jgi:hypothetical protein
MFSEKKILRTLEFMRKIYNNNDLDRMKNTNDVNEYKRKYVSWPCHDYYHLFDSDKKSIIDRSNWLGGRKKMYIEVRKKFGLHFLWNGKEKSSATIKFGNPKEFIEYNHYYNLINTINEDL